MEDKQSYCKKTLMSIEEDKVSRQVACDFCAVNSPRQRKSLQLDFEIHRMNQNHRSESKKLSVLIKPRGPPTLRTIFVANRNCVNRKVCKKNYSSEGCGNHTSITTRHSVDDSNAVRSGRSLGQGWKEPTKCLLQTCEATLHASVSTCVEKTDERNYNNDDIKYTKKYYLDAKSNSPINIFATANEPVVPKAIFKTALPQSQDQATSRTTSNPRTFGYQLGKRINKFQKNNILQEMVFRSLDGNITPASSDEESNERPSNSARSERAGCSYIEQYSHVPEASAFQRYAQAPLPPLSPPKGTSMDKEHNSEQYGRDFTTYDGITARNRRQSASVPCRREDSPKQAAERVHKIRHKLNPVRDYRLMDTVHYLAQGEFAPRDDGIKLTPSREAVLSDIIWEDVCRTHWPNARLNRRIVSHPERTCNSRRGSGELQRLIDNLLRERIAHVERRRRRHYRIVKLNNRHENSKPVGKTGDIIVASHKKKDRDLASSDHRATTVVSERRWAEHTTTRRGHKSHDLLTNNKHRHAIRSDECAPGPSYAVNRVTENREDNSVFNRADRERANQSHNIMCRSSAREAASGSSASKSSNRNSKSARLVIRKDVARRKHQREELNLEHYILLPTLVVRTPSNMRRQKKFNELYHRILYVHYRNRCDEEACAVGSEAVERQKDQSCEKRDIGLNINVTLSDSEEYFKKFAKNIQ